MWHNTLQPVNGVDSATKVVGKCWEETLWIFR